MDQITLHVSGMTCQGCVRSVTRVLQGVPGVSAVEVSLERGEAVISADSATATPHRLAEAVQGAGFDARVAKG